MTIATAAERYEGLRAQREKLSRELYRLRADVIMETETDPLEIAKAEQRWEADVAAVQRAIALVDEQLAAIEPELRADQEAAIQAAEKKMRPAREKAVADILVAARALQAAIMAARKVSEQCRQAGASGVRVPLRTGDLEGILKSYCR